MHPAVQLLVIVLGGGVAGAVIQAVVQRRLTRSGVVECAIRSLDPTRLHSTGRWRHGAARARPGLLEFRPGGPAGMRFPRGRPTTIEVSAVRIEEARRPSFRQVWSINPALRIAVLSTPTGEIEVAAPVRSLTDLHRRIQPPTT